MTFDRVMALGLRLFSNEQIYYIGLPINLINVPSFDTVDLTECDPTLRITSLWFSESISPLSETDDVLHKQSSLSTSRF